MNSAGALEVAAPMKRAVTTLLLCICRGCKAHFNGAGVAAVKRGRRKDELHRAISRPTFIHGKSCGNQQCCLADWPRLMQLCLPVRYIGLLYVVRVAFRRVVECERVNCA